MPTFGSPVDPCEGVARSKALLGSIAKDARANAANGTAETVKVEAGIRELRATAANTIGTACMQLCPTYERCILNNYDATDLLHGLEVLSPDQLAEYNAKFFLSELSFLAKIGMGIL